MAGGEEDGMQDADCVTVLSKTIRLLSQKRKRIFGISPLRGNDKKEAEVMGRDTNAKIYTSRIGETASISHYQQLPTPHFTSRKINEAVQIQQTCIVNGLHWTYSVAQSHNVFHMTSLPANRSFWVRVPILSE